MASRDSPILWSFQAQAQNRSALAGIRAGDVAAGFAGLAGALRVARDSQDRAAVAVVVDGVASAVLSTDGSRAGAERAAALLGAAHSIRGAFDHSSLDAPQVRDTARDTLGGEEFDAAYQRGRDLSYEDALAFAKDSTGAGGAGALT
jgi:hypothetical protein